VPSPAPPASIRRARTPAPLGRWERRVWPPAPGAFGSKAARKGGAYEVFLPAGIASRRFSFDDEAVVAIANATKALAELDGTTGVEPIGALASTLLRSESVASSRIEGIAISHNRLARAAFEETGGRGGDKKAAEVLGNVRAMRQAVEIGKRERFALEDVLDIHRTLLRHTDDEKIAGATRQEQNWIGGNDHNPVGADFVPRPHELTQGLLEDLCAFVERDDIASVAQAAIAHAQFENIHPFVDGNGRTGRALIYTVLRRRGDITDFVPPISLILGAEPRGYIGGLGAYSAGKVDRWCERFAYATARAAREAENLAVEIRRLQSKWIEQLGNPRQDAAVRQLVAALPAQPVVDVATGQQITGKSHVAIGGALQKLEAVGVLKPLDERRWGRVWECEKLLNLVGSFEKKVATL
jgi:Fic family protein